MAALPEPAFVFEDDLGAGDIKRYLCLPFDVPPGTGELRIDLHYEPMRIGGMKEIRDLLSISLFDPEGFRGAKHSGNNHKAATIAPAAATPGFLPGPLPAGRWTLELDTHLLLPGSTLGYRAEVRLTPGDGGNGVPLWQPQPPVRQRPGWYRGDLHTHTVHSDGGQTMAELFQSAREAGLDFVGLTDHNTIAQILDPVASACRDLALIPGMELTTYYGHALSLGTTEWIDWRTTHQGRTMGEAAADVRTAGGFSVIAHPAALGDPVCTGCAWLYTDDMPGVFDAVEVWNGPWFEMGNNNPINLHLWKQWLNREGRRIVATAGTDTHSPGQYGHKPAFSVVYAPELSAQGIMEGLRQGHVMLSAGPEVYVEAALTAGRTALMGDVVQREEVSALRVRWQGAPAGAVLRWVAGGETVAEWRGPEGIVAPALPEARWALAELWGADGALLAMTNPLYIH